MPALVASDWYVSAEKVQEAVHRLVEQVIPLAIIVFGSRARREHLEDSDLDDSAVFNHTHQALEKSLRYTRVATYSAICESGGGYVWDDVLEYRVWCRPERDAPDKEDGSDYYYAFVTSIASGY